MESTFFKDFKFYLGEKSDFYEFSQASIENPQDFLFQGSDDYDHIGNTGDYYRVKSGEKIFIARKFELDTLISVTLNLIEVTRRLEEEPFEGVRFEDLIGILRIKDESMEGEYLVTGYVEGSDLPSHARFMLKRNGKTTPDPDYGRVFHKDVRRFVDYHMPKVLGFEHTDAHGGNFLKSEGVIYAIDPVKFKRL